MASFVYNQAKGKIKDSDWTGGSVKTLLLQAGGTPNKDRDSIADIVAGAAGGAHDEVSVTGYARQTLGSPTAVVDDVADKVNFDAADTTYTSLAAGQTVGAEIQYLDVDGTDANAIPIHYTDFPDTPTDGNNFTVQYADPIWDNA